LNIQAESTLYSFISIQTLDNNNKMNKMLVIGLMAFVFSSCQSESAKTENVITPTPTGVPSASSVNSGQRPATNPAHGQPFHDCALPVGAAFAVENAPAQSNSVTATMDLQPEVQQQTAPITKEVKLNPAHGAAGHRCDIPEGAPLS